MTHCLRAEGPLFKYRQSNITHKEFYKQLESLKNEVKELSKIEKFGMTQEYAQACQYLLDTKAGASRWNLSVMGIT